MKEFLFRHLNILICIGIILVGYYIYHQAFDHQFLSWDDQFYISINPLLQNPTWESARSLLTKIVSLNYHPATMLSLWVNAYLSGIESARPFIMTNVIIHLANGILVYLLVNNLFKESKWIGSFTALCFVIHPLHIESVVWVSERKDVLYCFFFLLSLIFYSHFKDSSKKRYFLFSFIAFLLSALSKAMAVSLVPCLLLIDYLKSPDNILKHHLNKLPFLIAALGFGLVALDVQSGGDFYGLLVPSESADAVTNNISLSTRIVNAIYAHFYYVTQFYYPNGLSAFHPYTYRKSINIIFPILTFLLTFGFLIRTYYTKDRSSLFGILFYAFTIALVLQLIPVGSALVADRYAYLPYVGIAIITGGWLQAIWESRLKYLSPMLLLFFTALFITKSLDYLPKWKNHVSLFEHAKSIYPTDPFISKTLASGYWADSNIDQAIDELIFVIDSLGLRDARSYELLGNCLDDKGRHDLALVYLDKAVELDPTYIMARYHRGIILLHTDLPAAIIDFNFCEESQNDYVLPLLYSPRGRAHGMLGQYQKSVADLTKAIEYFPDDPNNYADRAVTYQRMGRQDLAKRDQEVASRLRENM